MKKCIIIGSGLGGLSCGVILAKNGYEVIILEQGAQIGGCLQCFRRGDITFETGMHFIGSADPGQTLHALLHYQEVNRNIELQRLDTEGYDIISFLGGHYALANGRDGFINTLSHEFPHSRGELADYYQLVKTVTDNSAMHSLNQHVDLGINTKYQLHSVNEVIGSVISDKILQQVLVGILPLYAGEMNRTPFSIHALISDFYNQSAFRIVGGSNKIASSLVKTVQAFGGKVLTRKKVTHINCDATHATGVDIQDGDHFDADLVISAIHPASTLGLVDSSLFRPVYRSRISNTANTVGAFTVYLKFKSKTMRYMNHNLYVYTSDHTWGCENYTEQTWPESLLYMHSCDEINPAFAKAGEIITYMRFADMKPWIGTTVGKRGDDYETFKQQRAEKLINTLEREVPGLRNTIETYYTSTPLTYLDYTGTPEGSMYGVARNVSTIGGVNISCKTRIPNLLLTGQNITSHGMLGVLAGTMMTCSEILSTEELFAQIKNITK